jgi:Ni/Fe-hydrogenase subunit HybB-like protein
MVRKLLPQDFCFWKWYRTVMAPVFIIEALDFGFGFV